MQGKVLHDERSENAGTNLVPVRPKSQLTQLDWRGDPQIASGILSMLAVHRCSTVASPRP